ncbi:MAG: LexA family protein [Candidatus Hodarchaeales archaeon]
MKRQIRQIFKRINNKKVKALKTKRKSKLTKQEQELWEFILEFLCDYKVTPLRTEIADALHISPQLVQYRLKRLEEKGWIELVPLIKRNIKIK